MKTKYNNKDFLKHLENELSKISDKELEKRYYGIWYMWETFSDFTEDKYGTNIEWKILADIVFIYINEIDKRANI